MKYNTAFKALIFLTFMAFSVNGRATISYSISEVRSLYGKGVEDAAAARELFELANAATPGDPLLMAYRGGAEALLAKHALNPYTKLDYLAKSMTTLRLAINTDPSNAEIRFIRFSIQYFIPKFLGYSKNLQDDAHVIALNFSTLNQVVDAKTVRSIGEFMISSGSCSNADVTLILKQL